MAGEQAGSRIGHLSGRGARLLRTAQVAPSRRLLVALGARCRRGHLGRFLRLEPRPRRRGLRRSAHRRHRHHGHVLRPVLQHRRDVAGTAAHGRRLLLLAVGDGPVGRLHHRVGREHGIRHHPRGRRGRDGIPLARHRFRPDRSRRVVEQPGAVVGDLLHHLRRDQHHRYRDHHAVHRGDHRRGARRPRRSSSWPCSSAGPSTPACSPTSRRRRAAAASCRRASPGSSPPCPSRSGSTWRSRNCRWPPRSLTIRSGTSPVRRSGGSTHWSSSPFSPCS